MGDVDGDQGNKHGAPYEFYRTDEAEEDPVKTPEVCLSMAIAHALIISYKWDVWGVRLGVRFLTSAPAEAGLRSLLLKPARRRDILRPAATAGSW